MFPHNTPSFEPVSFFNGLDACLCVTCAHFQRKCVGALCHVDIFKSQSVNLDFRVQLEFNSIACVSLKTHLKAPTLHGTPSLHARNWSSSPYESQFEVEQTDPLLSLTRSISLSFAVAFICGIRNITALVPGLTAVGPAAGAAAVSAVSASVFCFRLVVLRSKPSARRLKSEMFLPRKTKGSD